MKLPTNLNLQTNRQRFMEYNFKCFKVSADVEKTLGCLTFLLRQFNELQAVAFSEELGH